MLNLSLTYVLSFSTYRCAEPAPYVPYAVHTVLPESVPHELNQQTTDPRRDKMVVVYILLCILAVLLLYICFLAICSLCVDPKKEYEKNSRFYRTLLTALLPLL